MDAGRGRVAQQPALAHQEELAERGDAVVAAVEQAVAERGSLRGAVGAGLDCLDNTPLIDIKPYFAGRGRVDLRLGDAEIRVSIQGEPAGLGKGEGAGDGLGHATAGQHSHGEHHRRRQRRPPRAWPRERPADR